MISVVVVYNNEEILRGNLLKSLENQSSKHELILIDNTKKAFTSASSALNYGRRLAKGDFVLFVHQDLQLIGNDWLERCEPILRNAPEKAIFGSAGVTNTGRLINAGIDATFLNPSHLLEEVQLLDEGLFIVPKIVLQEFEFDEAFDDWHCYGADYCLSLKKEGVRSMILNLPIFHNSPRANPRSTLKREQLRLFNKHGKDFKIIFTANGILTANPVTGVVLTALLRLQFVPVLGLCARYMLLCYLKITRALRKTKSRLF